MVRFKEVKLDAKADVDSQARHRLVPRHARRNAARAPLRHDEQGDAFTVPLTNLETFEVDYLEKNLKVRIKGGKQYNFTDPRGTPTACSSFSGTSTRRGSGC
jgi:hypothetical protein